MHSGKAELPWSQNVFLDFSSFRELGANTSRGAARKKTEPTASVPRCVKEALFCILIFFFFITHIGQWSMSSKVLISTRTSLNTVH